MINFYGDKLVIKTNRRHFVFLNTKLWEMDTGFNVERRRTDDNSLVRGSSHVEYLKKIKKRAPYLLYLGEL